MSIQFWIWSHLSFIFLVAWILCPLCRRRNGVATKTLSCIAIAGLAILPIQHLDLSGLVLGHIGVLSASTVILLLQSLTSRRGLTDTEDRTLNGVWFLVGAAVYTSTFGFTESDLYALGYQAHMPWVVLAMSGLAALLRHWLLAVCLVTAVLAHQWRLCESPNLWDSMIDPWLFFAATFKLLHWAIRRKPLRDTTVTHTQQIV